MGNRAVKSQKSIEETFKSLSKNNSLDVKGLEALYVSVRQTVDKECGKREDEHENHKQQFFQSIPGFELYFAFLYIDSHLAVKSHDFKLGYDMEDKAAEIFFTALDTDKSGSVEFSEIEYAMSLAGSKEIEHVLEFVFRAINQSCSGVLEQKEYDVCVDTYLIPKESSIKSGCSMQEFIDLGKNDEELISSLKINKSFLMLPNAKLD